MTEKTLVTLTVTDSFNCSSVDTAEFNVVNCCMVYVPNAFSPNGDEINDMILPALEQDVKLTKFVVYNRWGEVVFQTNQKNIAWDGYHKGLPVDLGIYYYLLQYECDGKESTIKGDILLIR